MNNLRQPTIDTNPVGRHGRIGREILPRDIEYPRFDRAFVEQGMSIVATADIVVSETDSDTVRPGVEKPIEAPGYYL